MTELTINEKIEHFYNFLCVRFNYNGISRFHVDYNQIIGFSDTFQFSKCIHCFVLLNENRYEKNYFCDGSYRYYDMRTKTFVSFDNYQDFFKFYEDLVNEKIQKLY